MEMEVLVEGDNLDMEEVPLYLHDHMEEVLVAYMVVELNRDLEELAYMCLHDYNFVVVEVEDNLVFVEDNLVAVVDNLVVEEDNLVVVGENLVRMEYMFENVDIFHRLRKNLIENHHY
jgi:hypothetical protein